MSKSWRPSSTAHVFFCLLFFACDLYWTTNKQWHNTKYWRVNGKGANPWLWPHDRDKTTKQTEQTMNTETDTRDRTSEWQEATESEHTTVLVQRKKREYWFLHNEAPREANRKKGVLRNEGVIGRLGGRRGCSQVESSRGIDFIALGWLYPVTDRQNERIPPDRWLDLLAHARPADEMTTSSEMEATDLSRR